MIGSEILRWTLAGLYAAVAVIAWRAGRATALHERRFWRSTAIALSLLGLAKGLHLQDDLTRLARGAARNAGFYNLHADIQAVFLIAVVLFAAIGAVAALHYLKGSSGTAKWAATALGLVTIFILIRAASIHAMDSWAMTPFGGMRRGWWIELAGLMIVGSAAISDRRADR